MVSSSKNRTLSNVSKDLLFDSRDKFYTATEIHPLVTNPHYLQVHALLS